MRRAGRQRVLGDRKVIRKIMGYRDLWALKAILDGSQPATGRRWRRMTMNSPRNLQLRSGYVLPGTDSVSLRPSSL